MPKFKVGDRVKLISMSPRFGFGPVIKTGALGIVTHVAMTTWDRPEIYVNFPKHREWMGMHSEFILVPKKPTIPKTKEKSMTENTTTKKPGTPHGKPTAKGMKADLKPKAKTAPKPKYPAPRVQRELIAEAKPLEKRTKAELIVMAEDRATQFHNLSADYCVEGTKLDRALVDLKEAKAKIKELSKALEATK